MTTEAIDISNMPESVRRQYERSMKAIEKQQEAINGAQETEHKQPDPAPEPAPVQQQEHRESEKPAIAEQHGDDWQQKYKLLQGKYNAEVPRMAETIRDLKTQLSAITAELEVLKTQKPTEPQGAFKEMLDVFGADDPQVKFATEAAAEIASLKATISQLSNQLTGVKEYQAETAEDRFYAALQRHCPDWESVNMEPELILWLNEYDELMGATRKQIFDDAAARLDAGRVAAFFNKYKAGKAVVAPVVAKPKPSDGLKAQVVPETNSGGGGNDTAATTLTRAKVAEFYRKVAKEGGATYNGSAEDFQRMNREILEASAKGLIVS